jgi:hypothetical protein
VAAGRAAPPAVIKCDIEGAEHAALVGARHIIERFSPVIFLATHAPDVHRGCCAFLSGLGYRLSALDGMALEQSSELLARR